MIEITDEMLDQMEDWASQDEVNRHSAVNYIFNIIRLHEANKPKPEPVAWAMCRFEHIFETKEWAEKYREDWNMRDEPITPIYTTPPTREPLSDDDIWRIYDEGDNVSSSLEFARSIEKAHGIGV